MTTNASYHVLLRLEFRGHARGTLTNHHQLPRIGRLEGVVFRQRLVRPLSLGAPSSSVDPMSRFRPFLGPTASAVWSANAITRFDRSRDSMEPFGIPQASSPATVIVSGASPERPMVVAQPSVGSIPPRLDERCLLPASGAKTRDESVTTPPMGFVSSWRSRLGQLICVGFHTVAVPLRVPPPLSEDCPGRSALFHAESAYRILPSGVFPLRKPHTSRCRCSLAVTASSWLPGCPCYPRPSHSPGFARLDQIL